MTLPANAADPDVFCSILSREYGEPLTGTAAERTFWLLLEYDARWLPQATTDNNLPAHVQEWLDDQLEAAGSSGRLLFIRRPRREGEGEVKLNFFVALAGEEEPALYHFALQDYDDLLPLNPSSLLVDRAGYAGQRLETPLFLVCTHGSRDRCCSRNGIPVFQALQESAGDLAWQSSHVGGHRFAANVVTFPDATYYGRMSPAEAPALVAARRRGEVFLPHLRGRGCYPEVVQAADCFLREKSGETALGAYRFAVLEPHEDDSWTVTFDEVAGGHRHRLHVTRDVLDKPLYASCGQLQTKPVWSYHLLDHQRIPAG
jgi:hypothetical protein